MFTGIVQAIGRVVSLTPDQSGARLLIDPRGWPYHPNPGDSIAVSGCCLTHAPDKGDVTLFGFDVVRQTLDRTTLGQLRPGQDVNLESCLTATTPVGGHFVQGHIDGVATVENISNTEGDHRVTIQTNEKVIRYIVPTGSIAIDGVSLTVANVDAPKHQFTVALIPTTLLVTTLGQLKAGVTVNIETDILSRTVVHYLSNFTSPNA